MLLASEYELNASTGHATDIHINGNELLLKQSYSIQL